MPDKPKFVVVDLTELQDNGVLLAANERFFWPLGLALTWTHDQKTHAASELHVREWVWPDGHHETIEPEEPLPERRARWRRWLAARIKSMPVDERGKAEQL